MNMMISREEKEKKKEKTLQWPKPRIYINARWDFFLGGGVFFGLLALGEAGLYAC